VKERKDPWMTMACDQPAVEEGIVPGAASPCSVSEQLKRIKTANDDQKTGVESSARRFLAGAPMRSTRRGRWHRRQDPREGSVLLRLDSQSGILNLISKGIIGPDQVWCGDPEPESVGSASDHHRSHGGRTAEKNAAGMPRAAAWAAWISDQPFKRLKCKTPAAMAGFLF